MRRMMTMLAVACSLVMAGCAQLSTGVTPAQASAAIDKVEARYGAAKMFAEMLMPLLSDERQAIIRKAETIIEKAIAAARIAATAAEQIAALKQAEAALAALEDVPAVPISVTTTG